MKRRNRFAVMTLSVALATALVGVSGGRHRLSLEQPADSCTGLPELQGVTLNLMYGSSGRRRDRRPSTRRQSAWAKLQRGNKVVVTNASNNERTLDEAFAGGLRPTLFYLSANRSRPSPRRANYCPTRPRCPAADFYSSLVQADTYNKTWYCVPKDFANLALEINTTMWNAAGPDQCRPPDHMGQAPG